MAGVLDTYVPTKADYVDPFEGLKLPTAAELKQRGVTRLVLTGAAMPDALEGYAAELKTQGIQTVHVSIEPPKGQHEKYNAQ